MEENNISGFVGATIERGKVSLKEVLWKAVGWLFLVIVAGVILLTASVFAFYGAALGLAEVFGNRIWLGCLVSGVAFLAFIFIAVQIQKYRSRKAKSVLFRKTAESSEELAAGLDPRPWIRNHPWETTGMAALGGFAVGFRSEKAGSITASSMIDSLIDPLIRAGIEILKNALTPIITTEVAKRLNKQD